ncbi:MAG TPA: neutral zinc metallopeptidase [Nocardioidaceae bacterium]|nr:neutral zinc metallopeptidase [Nocardioidaceae bacterium]
MRFNPKARLDRSQVQNRRGSSGRGGGMGFPVRAGGRGLGVGGGIGGVIVLIIIVLLNSGLFSGGGGQDSAPGSGSGSGPVSTGGEQLSHCRTGADANQDRDCARVAIVNSIQSFWSQALPQQSDARYTEADTVIFSDRVDTGCGAATAQVGPFYCPVDKLVYLDTTFFKDMLEGQLGGTDADFAEAYVLAHEYGHHVQDLLGTMGRVRTQQGAGSDAVRLELQADCYAGMWTRFATRAEDADGQVLIQELTPTDIEEALDAARAVGDDRIQQKTSGRVNPDAWTHGSAEQRMRWFSIGKDQGTLRACDTFSARQL